MLRDVFYFGNKPNTHPREKFAKNLEDARNQCTTDHFWVINEHCDYSGFDGTLILISYPTKKYGPRIISMSGLALIKKIAAHG